VGLVKCSACLTRLVFLRVFLIKGFLKGWGNKIFGVKWVDAKIFLEQKIGEIIGTVLVNGEGSDFFGG
jgi:hypothetical protein